MIVTTRRILPPKKYLGGEDIVASIEGAVTRHTLMS